MSKPIEIHPDGAVTLRLSARAWAHASRAASNALNRTNLSGDCKAFFETVSEEHQLDGPNPSSLSFSVAIVVGALAVLARDELASYIAAGLPFVHHGAGPLLDELADLGVVPFDHGATPESVVAALVTTPGAVTT